MNILITGVTSFIGRALAKELIDEGYEVYGMVRPSSLNKEMLPRQLHIVELDMCDAERLPEVMPDNMQVCIHLAWDSAGRDGRMNKDIQDKNADRTLVFMKAAALCGCKRFIFAGSQAEYGITLEKVKEDSSYKEKIDEKKLPEPVSEYGKAKLRVLSEGKKICEELGMSYFHLRIFSCYGKGDHEGTLTSSCISAMKTGRHISLSPCRQMWNFIEVTDLARAVASLVSATVIRADEEDEKEYVINIGSAISKPLKEYVAEIHEVIQNGTYDFERQFNPEEGIPYLNPDITKLEMITGFRESVSFKEGIKRASE